MRVGIVLVFVVAGLFVYATFSQGPSKGCCDAYRSVAPSDAGEGLLPPVESATTPFVCFLE
jgi:hypothetical protein